MMRSSHGEIVSGGQHKLDIVQYLGQDWDIYSNHGLTRALGRQLEGRGKLLLIEQPICPIMSPIWHRRKFVQWLQGKRGLRQVADNIYVCTPWYLLHDRINYFVPVTAALNRRLLSTYLTWLCQEIGFSGTRVAWFVNPLQMNFQGLVHEAVTIYHCWDFHGAARPRWHPERRIIEANERALLAAADLVFTTSESLYRERSPYNPRTHLLLNAADYEHFSNAQDKRTPLSPLVAKIAHPIIGYLGRINRHTDLELLVAIARQRPDWSLVLIGPIEQQLVKMSVAYRALTRLPNVHFLGWIDYNDLPSYCRAFDVCVIPYRTDSEFNQYVYPDKLNEYLAMGKPVISTDIPEVRRYEGLIRIGRTPQDIARQIEAALAGDNEVLVRARMRTAAENSWTRRAECVVEIIDAQLGHGLRTPSRVPTCG